MKLSEELLDEDCWASDAEAATMHEWGARAHELETKVAELETELFIAEAHIEQLEQKPKYREGASIEVRLAIAMQNAFNRGYEEGKKESQAKLARIERWAQDKIDRVVTLDEAQCGAQVISILDEE